MKNCNKWMLLILLIALIQTPKLAAQSEKPLPDSTGTAYGLDPAKLYEGDFVIELLGVAEEEIDLTAEHAWNEGYKAAALIWKPEAEYWQKSAESYRAEIKKPYMPWWSVPVSALVSFFGGIAVMSLASTAGGAR